MERASGERRPFQDVYGGTLTRVWHMSGPVGVPISPRWEVTLFLIIDKERTRKNEHSAYRVGVASPGLRPRKNGLSFDGLCSSGGVAVSQKTDEELSVAWPHFAMQSSFRATS